jgi:hypothetical protein
MGLVFSEIKIGSKFHFNGNDYVKQSSRTARMLSNSRVFYFAQKELAHLVSW